nr:DUF1847 domain-containing protein [Sedimentibacter sp.]
MNGKCSQCGLNDRICRTPEGKAPGFCSTIIYDEALRKAEELYEKDDIKHFAAEASRQEAACYVDAPNNSGDKMAIKPRILEIIEFCNRMNYKRIGLAFCGGLHREAKIVNNIFESHGLEVVSAMCKVGGVDKSSLGLEDFEKINGEGHESMCNPIGQAMIMNEAKTEFNIILGLCVGHDSLFIKHSDAMCTVLAVKDRVLGHNPLAAIYTSESYYKYIK